MIIWNISISCNDRKTVHKRREVQQRHTRRVLLILISKVKYGQISQEGKMIHTYPADFSRIFYRITTGIYDAATDVSFSNDNRSNFKLFSLYWTTLRVRCHIQYSNLLCKINITKRLSKSAMSCTAWRVLRQRCPTAPQSPAHRSSL
jgi:hypothetical protein